MKAKYIVKDNIVIKQTFDSFASKFPFDSAAVYVGGGNYTTQNICDMLEAAYKSGARHALTEVHHHVNELNRDYQL